MRRASVVGVLAAAVAATTLPDNVPGIAVPLVAILVAAAVALAAPVDAVALGYGLLSVMLSAMAAVRAAEWVVALDLLGSLFFATLAASGLESWGDLLRAPLRVLASAGRAPGILLRPLLPRWRGAGRAVPVLRGVVVGLLLVLGFGALFVSADRAFAEIVDRLLIPSWDLDLLPLRLFVFVSVGLLVGALAASRPALLGEPRPLSGATGREGAWEGRRRSVVEWGITLGLLDALFLIFVAVQITFLFGGHELVQRTLGLTYATYAREGFFQLLIAAGLVLAVVAAAVRSSAAETERDRRILKTALGILCLLTLVILASALRRLSLYEEAFGFTRPRLVAHSLLLWVGAVVLMVIAAGFRWQGRWLPRAVAALAGASLLLFSAIDPDGTIASRNVERYERVGKIDLAYARTLSLDAVPALARLPHELRREALLAFDRPPADGWAGWNLGRSRARSILASPGEGRS